MQQLPRQILCELIAEYGPGVSRDARRCEALLRDRCGLNRREVNVLVAAVRARVTADLLCAPAATPRPALLSRLSRRLTDDFALTDEAAQWAAESWAVALGVIQPDSNPEPDLQHAAAGNSTPPSHKVGAVPPVQVADENESGDFLRSASTANSLVNPTDGATMLRIPSGEFLMGDDDQKDNPRRRVYVDSYWFYKTPVSVAQYTRFCNATGQTLPPAPGAGWQDDHPVVNVSWIDASAYADWAGVSLPTETQWERAARGSDGRLYPWGNGWEAARCVNSVGTARTATAPCGSIPAGASVYGVLDMAGNVWEWCEDWYDETHLRAAPLRNPSGPEIGQRRVLRGASWNDSQRFVFRASMRFRHDPLERSSSIGFRCAAPVERR